jgi:hypothetical protein
VPLYLLHVWGGLSGQMTVREMEPPFLRLLPVFHVPGRNASGKLSDAEIRKPKILSSSETLATTVSTKIRQWKLIFIAARKTCLINWITPARNGHLKHRGRHRSALFWVITQRRAVNPYQSFGTTYRFHLRGSRNTGRKKYNFASILPTLL